MQVVIAATGDDEDNLIVSGLAHQAFGVPHVLARVNRPENRWLLTPQLGVGAAFCLALVLVDLVKQGIDNKAAKI